MTGAAYWTANARDPSFNLLQQTFGNGIVANQTFDPLDGRLTSVMTGPNNFVQSLSCAYDTLGNLTERVDGNFGLNETFTYDSLNRLTAMAIAYVTTKYYTSDAVGNILSKSDVGT